MVVTIAELIDHTPHYQGNLITFDGDIEVAIRMLHHTLDKKQGWNIPWGCYREYLLLESEEIRKKPLERRVEQLEWLVNRCVMLSV